MTSTTWMSAPADRATLLSAYVGPLSSAARSLRRRHGAGHLAEQLEDSARALHAVARRMARGEDVSQEMPAQLATLTRFIEELGLLGWHWCRLEVQTVRRDLAGFFRIPIA